MKTHAFIKESRIPAPVETTFDWHARPGALERLTPPWESLRVIEKTGGIEKGARVTVKIKAGPLPMIWKAVHTDYAEHKMFRDQQIKGPFAKWVHTHLFEPDGPDACIMKDHVAYALRFQPFGPFLAGPMVRKQLDAMFRYRHDTLIHDLQDHMARPDKRPMTFLISGASGVVGTALIPFLTAGGHRVVRLVRNPADAGPDAVYWNPAEDVLDKKQLPPVDAVIHLAGENIGKGRWTPKKKKRIIESRTRGTALLARTAAELSPRPGAFICASAIGYYGNRCDDLMEECEGPGCDFISQVCDLWEKASVPAIKQGVRTVYLRIGIALTPAGGALRRLLPTFIRGLGGKISSGDQYMSWIGIDDVIGAIYHAVYHEDLEGPVNVTAPHPATNRDFTRTLAKTLSRPAPFTIPAVAIRAAFGRMGEEILLSSTRVTPRKLLESGYRFRHPRLGPALAHLLGKPAASRY